MAGRSILLEDVLAATVGPLEPGHNILVQKGLIGSGIEAFADGDENRRAALSI